MNKLLLSIKELTKSYTSLDGCAAAALRGLTLSAGAGELLCLLGPNGSGKTTLFKILSGIVLPDGGSVELAGMDLVRFPDESKRRAGFSPGEERSFYGRLTGLENLRFFAALRGIQGNDFTARLHTLESSLGLKEILPLSYQKTSAGMKQRLSLARALLHDPELLLLDEPTKSLDPGAADELRGLARRVLLPAGRLLLWSTHNIQEAFDIGTRLALLSGGRLIAQGSPKELLERTGAASPAEAYRILSSAS